MAGIELIGSDILAAQLLGIPQKIRTAIETTAMKEAGKLVAGTLQQNIAAAGLQGTGALQKSIKQDVRVGRGGSVVIGRVGADNNFVKTDKSGKKRRPAKYYHLVNLGTKPRQVNFGKKRDRGSVTGMNFKEQTEQQTADQVQQILVKTVQEALNQ
jgi:hypothetical protein